MRNLAGITALALGGIYGYGALIRATQLAGADLVVQDTLPLFSLEQILVTGMSKLLLLAILVLAVGLVTMVLSDAQKAGGGPPPPAPPGRPVLNVPAGSMRARVFRVVASWPSIAIVWIIFIFTASTPIIVVQIAVMGGLVWLYLSNWIRQQTFFAAVAIVWALTTAAFNLAFPDRLPAVTLHTRDAGVVRGQLITRNDSTWFVRVGDRAYRAIEANRVTDSKVSSRERPDGGKSLLDRFRD